MNTVNQVLTELKKKGSAQTVKIYTNHGAPPEMLGVKVADLKVIAKKIKGNQALALELYETGNADAMYLAGMVADGSQMTKKQLNDWAKQAGWYMQSEYTVPWVASESKHGRDLANKWIKSKQEKIAASGWATYSALLSVLDDEQLDKDEIQDLLSSIPDKIDEAANRVRYCMNGFVISVGCYFKPLLKKAKTISKKIGKVEVDMGGTACKVPLATDYIAKVEARGTIGKKRKTAKC